MKILYICSLYAPHVGGGAEISLRNLVKGMRARGHDVTVLTTGPVAGLVTDIVDEVKVYRAGLKNIFWHHSRERRNPLARAFWHVKDSYNEAMRDYVRLVIERERPDVVSCHNLTGWSISAWDEIKASNVPFVQVLHDLYLVCARSNRFRAGKVCLKPCNGCRLLRKRHARASMAASAVVGVSQYILNVMRDSGYFAGVLGKTIYNARNIPLIDLSTPINSVPVKFGYIGTLSEAKGVEWMLEEFQASNAEGTLYLAGKGEPRYEAYLKNKFASSRVVFVGYVEPREFFKTVEVCVVPSLWPEPLGMVAAEACAYGIPVITTRQGGLPEIIKDGINGFLCDTKDKNSLRRAIERVTSDPSVYISLAENARESVQDFIDPDKMLKKYEDLLLDVHLTQCGVTI
ncbi:glycosyltransferase family 4 protein [Paraburkholderia nemoris]|uniref:N-acetyl-alpha-D-glucosaminyl L-malate synthase n=1 Tax=Paraburkholderia nemoris TaxID=2793076 RepID=A0ABM8SI05_9BURK|nr:MULTISPECIES: glycosyltransferase family 4 protein [Paraburkholderia]MBK5149468.1 glycosyltransferase family 4 protein [Burkholderia sp. R-69608]MBK3813068.1 glycosyltransferase family 4 protein [Paraburkholderia aspalathi]CAE6799974.1 N-acetyl-alpha-D-glucosaminyl L-malate synthase [Paraburkholderia nemoris]CAE6811278.1 N-acetyl-alpha-D-glucosaminyl L-malate synthase [Paraburkholderia nemoris]CAE6902579.1 N-acetyl-alpha-D-glucosaminyl L-malate synthase [Paraburkholderia nemoris]